MNQALQENNPGLVNIDWDYEPNKPELKLQIDYQQAQALGVSYRNISETLQILLGSKRVTTFQNDGEEIDILIKAEHQWFQSPQDLEQIYLRSDTTGKMIPLSAISSISTVGESSSLTRYNRVRSITL